MGLAAPDDPKGRLIGEATPDDRQGIGQVRYARKIRHTTPWTTVWIWNILSRIGRVVRSSARSILVNLSFLRRTFAGNSWQCFPTCHV